jgi:hypothetical protein
MAMDEWEALGDVVGATVRKGDAVSDTSGGDEWEMLGDVVKKPEAKKASASPAGEGPDPFNTRKMVGGKAYWKNKEHGTIVDEAGTQVNDPAVLKAFGMMQPTKAGRKLINIQDMDAGKTPTYSNDHVEVITGGVDESSAGGDLAAGWQFLKQAYAGQDFAGFDARAEAARKFAQAQANNPYLTPEQKALIGAAYEREIGDLTEKQAGAAVRIGAATTAAQQYPESPAAARFNQAKTFGEAMDAFVSDPYSVTRSTTLRSAAVSIPSVVGGIVGSAAGPPGAAALAGAGSGWAEFGSALADGLQEKGAKLDDAASIMAVWKQHGPEIAKKARVRAGIIGAVDAGTAGIGSKIAASPMGTVKRELAGTLTQMGGGAVGEAGAQIGTEGKITQPGAIAGEMLGELGSGAAEQGGQIAVEGLRRTLSAPGKTDLPPPSPAAAPGKGDVPKPKPAAAPQAAAPAPGAAPRAPDDFSGMGTVVNKRKGGINVNPSEAQKAAGNYKKGHINVQGLDITLENPKGSERKGKAPDGTEWKATLAGDYGYIKRTEGADGDQVDVFIGDTPDSGRVFVIDQVDAETGNFDEHKAILSVGSAQEATDIYTRSFSDQKGADRIGAVHEMTVDEFKEWVKSGDTKKPLWERSPKPAGGDVPAPAQAAPPVASKPVSGAPVPGTAKPAPRVSKAPETPAPAAAPADGQNDVAAVTPEKPVTAPNPVKSNIVQDRAMQQIARRDVADDEAITASGRKVPVKYAVVEAADLVPSQLDDGNANPAYPTELQPRDRERRMSGAQVQDIASRLEPRWLDKSAKASDGAPIVSADGVVESGNGRTLAIRRAYQRRMPGAERYRAYLAEQGYPVDGMTEPVLVRVRQGDMTTEERISLAEDANEDDKLDLSTPERAMIDARKLGDDIVALYRGGDVDQAGNREFVRAFLEKVVSKGNRGKMVDGEGVINQDGLKRIGAALLAKAYGDADLIGKLMESTDVNIKGIGGALLDVAGSWAQMRAEAAAGKISGETDQSKALLEAVRMVDRSRRENKPLALLVGQNDIFTGTGIPVETEFFLRLMFRNTEEWKQPVSRVGLSESLRFFVAEARKTFEGTDLLGETAPRSKDILAVAKRKQTDDAEGDTADQEQLALAKPQRSVKEDGPADVEDTGKAGGQGTGQEAGSAKAESGGKTAPDRQPERVAEKPASAVPAVPAADGLFLKVGSKQWPIDSYKQASEVYEKVRDAADATATGATGPKMPDAIIVDGTGKQVAHISYNGRVWAGTALDQRPGAKPLYDNRSPEEEARVSGKPAADQIVGPNKVIEGLPQGTTDNSSAAKPASDSVAVNAGQADNGAQRMTAEEKADQGIAVDVARGVVAKVIGAIEDRKVLKSVIEAVPIDVMNMLIGTQWTPNGLLGDPTMLRQALTIPVGAAVSPAVRLFADAVLSISKTPAFVAAVASIGPNVGVVTGESRVANDTGQREVGQSAGSSAEAKQSGRRLVSDERAAELRQRLKSKFRGQLNSGIDPEMLAIGAELAVWHIENGVRRFAEVSRAIARDLDVALETLRPYLRGFYNGARDLMEDNGLDVDGMEDAEQVKAEMAKLFGKEPKPAAKEEAKPAPAPAAPVAGDPLDRPGPWRDADIVVTLDDGSKEAMNAGQAVDLMKRRISAVSQLLECVRAA